MYVHIQPSNTATSETTLNASMKSSNNINAAYVTSALAWEDILKDMCNLCMKARTDLDISTACQLINFKNYKESVHEKLKQHHWNIAKDF